MQAQALVRRASSSRTDASIIGLISISSQPPGLSRSAAAGISRSMTSVPARPGLECLPRLKVFYCGGQLSKFGRTDVGRIAGHEIEPPIRRHGREEIALEPLDPLSDAMSRGILASDRQRRRTQVDRRDARLRKVASDGDGDNSASCADVRDSEASCRPARVAWPNPTIGRRAARSPAVGSAHRASRGTRGNKTPCARPNTRPASLRRGGERVRGNARGWPRRPARRTPCKVDPLAITNGGQQNLGIQPRRLGPLPLQIIGRPGKQTADGPLFCHARRGRVAWASAHVGSVIARGMKPTPRRRSEVGSVRVLWQERLVETI